MTYSGAPLLLSVLNSVYSAGDSINNGPLFESDLFETERGPLRISFIGHGSLMMEFDYLIIHIDPCSQMADYALLPKADLILITHGHSDHLDKKAISLISKDSTHIICGKSAAGTLPMADCMENGTKRNHHKIRLEAVPAYNTTIEHLHFHPKGEGNGYVLRMGGMGVYVAGDTEFIPEMESLKNINIAFLPVNQPYTMTIDQAVNAAKAIKPAILYPYHFSDTDITRLVSALEKDTSIAVRIRRLR